MQVTFDDKSNANSCVCKVCDFGFARDIMANNIYERKSEGKLPIRLVATIVTFISFFYVLTCITLLSSIYPLPAIHSLLVTSRFGNINQPYKREFIGRIKSVINYLPRCTYHLLYLFKLFVWSCCGKYFEQYCCR